MPKYYRDFPRGYSLEEELPFIEIYGERCQVGTAGSIIICCPKCAREAFRIDPTIGRDFKSNENCWDCGIPREAVKLSELNTRWRPLYESLGIKGTSLEQRREERLEEERERPWSWVFGNQTEADYPDGFVRVA